MEVQHASVGGTRAELADFNRDHRSLLLSAMAIVIGAASAFIGYALLVLINVITNLAFHQRVSIAPSTPVGSHLGVLVVVVPAIGGLVIGLMARYGSEKIRGHGIPEALEAILIGRSRIGAKVALLKPLSSAISIGTGGPFGAEGPIIMTGGAFGSLFAQAFHLSSVERKTLLVAGAAGGMAAIFATPVAAVLLAVELLLFEWKPRSFIPVALAAVTAWVVRGFLLGAGPMFPMQPHAQPMPVDIALALGVGVAAGLVSSLLTVLVYLFEDLFRKLPLHWMFWPVIGGLVVGVGGLIDIRALGVGYDTIGALLRGAVGGRAVLTLVVVKVLIWAIALGSGTSGGVLAPLLIIGGAVGALEAHVIPGGDASLWVMVSMGAMMGGTMRSPFTAAVFMVELTHDVAALPALFVACIAADAVTVLIMRRSILTEKIARRGLHLTREYSVDPFELIRVAEVMDPAPDVVLPTMSVRAFAEQFLYGRAERKHHAFPVVDASGSLIGIITRGDVFQWQNLRGNLDVPIIVICNCDPIVAYPDELVSTAMNRMLENAVGRLLVVSRERPSRLVGYLGRPEVIEARRRSLHEEQVRERGWGADRPAAVRGADEEAGVVE